MKHLTQEEKKIIRQAVQNAERQTSGEFVTIIARRSDLYFFIPIMWAAIIALVSIVPLVFFNILTDPGVILNIQLAGFVLVFLLLQLDSVKMKFVPKQIKKTMVHKFALEQFVLQGVSHTKDHSGVLFFVSMAEKRVEIIADKGIQEKAGQEAWSLIVDEFVENVHNQQMCQGFVTAIEKCGKLMAKHFPRESTDTNELSDKLVEM